MTHKNAHRIVKSPPALIKIIMLAVAIGFTIGTPAIAADAANRQQAIDKALQQNGGQGKVLGVTTSQNQNGETVFAVKVLANGRVQVFRFTQVN